MTIQILCLKQPTILAINMMDEVKKTANRLMQSVFHASGNTGCLVAEQVTE